MRTFKLAVFILSWLLLSPAAAFGLRTHLYIADQILADVTPDCRVTVKGAELYIPADVCESVRAYPESFRAGVIGPDGFPDFISGQVTTHPGIKDDWQTADWIDRLLTRAAPGPELAFAAGYALHAAMDSFAHSYVNNYAGDIFDLQDERAVERRHFVLEKYIDYSLPRQPSATNITAPLEFLSEELIFADGPARANCKAAAALHLCSMKSVRQSVQQVDKQLQNLDDMARDLLADIVARHAQAAVTLASGEDGLQVALIALGANRKLLELKRLVLDNEESLLNTAIGLVDRNKEDIILSKQRAKAARQTINTAYEAQIRLVEFKGNAQRDLIRLKQELLNVPAKVTKEVCNSVGGVCNSCGWLCSPVCEPAKLVCRGVEVTNDVWARLNLTIRQLEDSIARADQDYAEAALSIQLNLAEETNQLQYAAEQELLTASIVASREAVKLRYDFARAEYEAELNLTNQADEKVKELRAYVEALRKNLIDVEYIEHAVQEVYDSVRPISAFTSNWLRGIDRAGARYIEAAQKSAVNMVAGTDGVISPYLDWFKCHGSVFTGVPEQVPTTICGGQKFVEHLEEKLDRIVESILPEPFASVYRAVNRIKADVKGEVKAVTQDAATNFAKLVSPDDATDEFIDLLVNPKYATRDKLREVFSNKDDAAGKDLLVFANAASMVDQDVHLIDGSLDPEGFLALHYATIFSKISLLDRDGIRALVVRMGGDPAKLSLSAGSGRYSVLVDTLRSIDGNHQWQPFGLPFPRATGYAFPVDPHARSFGYGPGASRPGFPLFVNPELRRDVFSHIFPKPFIGLIGADGALKDPRYPFETCLSNTFPVSFTGDGAASLNDSTCATSPSGKGLRPSSWAAFKRGLRGFLENAFGFRSRPAWTGSRVELRP